MVSEWYNLSPALPESVLLLLRLQQLPGHGDDGDRPQPQERGRPGVQQVRVWPDLETYQPPAAWWPGSSSRGRARSSAGAGGAPRPSRSCGPRWTSSGTWRSCRTRSAARWGRGDDIYSSLDIYYLLCLSPERCPVLHQPVEPGHQARAGAAAHNVAGAGGRGGDRPAPQGGHSVATEGS